MKRSPMKRTKGPKRTRKSRPMTPDAMGKLWGAVTARDGRCVFSYYECEGQTDAAHIIPQQKLKAHFEGERLAELLDDPRNAVAGCRKHHALFDNGQLNLPANPEGFEEFCAETGFFQSEGRWVKEAK